MACGGGYLEHGQGEHTGKHDVDLVANERSYGIEIRLASFPPMG